MTSSHRLPAWLVQVLSVLTRPILFVHFTLYEKAVRLGPFPREQGTPNIEGPNQRRLLFVGDIAVSGFGVLHGGMAVPAQAAGALAASSNRGIAWQIVGSPSLRAARALAWLPRLQKFDAAVIMLGVPDVLLVTRSAEWARNLRDLATEIRRTSGPRTALVFAAIPPMQDFRPIPPLGRALIAGQIGRLNVVTAAVAAEVGAEYVPFPVWRVTEMFNEHAFSYGAMHRMWAKALVPALASEIVVGRSDSLV